MKKKIAYLEELLEKEREINAQLRSQLSDSQQELQDLLVKIEYYEMMEEDLKSQIQLKEKELEGTAMKGDYELLISNLKRQLEKISQQNGELKRQYQTMKESLEEELKKLKYSNEEYQRQSIQHQLLNDQLQFSLQQIAESESLQRDLSHQNKLLQDEVNQMKERLIGSSQSSDQIHSDNNDLKSKNELLMKEIEELKQRLIDQQKQNQQKNEEIKKDFVDKNNNLQNELKSVKEENHFSQKELEKQLNETLNRIDLLENDKQSLSNQIDQINKDWNKKYSELDDQLNEVKSANQKLIHNQNNETRSLADQIDRSNSEWEGKHDELLTQLNRAKEVISRLQNDQENQTNESQRKFGDLTNENQKLKENASSVRNENKQLIDKINELEEMAKEEKKKLSTTVVQLQKENENLQISSKNLHEEKTKEFNDQKLTMEQLEFQLQKAIERAVHAERLLKETSNELKKLKLELDGEEGAGGETSENTIGLRQQLALLQQKNLELLNDDSAVREAKRTFQNEMQKALSETKELLIENFNREINEYKAQISKLEKDHAQKFSSMELGYEQQLRNQKLSLDENYRDILEQTKNNVQTYKTKYDDLNENFQTLTTWMMSGMANNGIAPDSNFNPSVVKVSFMLKKGDRIKNWKRRLFMLKNDGEVVYYGTTDSPKPRGTINLRELTELKQSPGTAELPDSLDIITPGRIWNLHFDNPDLEKAWQKIIKDFMNKRRSSIRM